MHLNQTKQHHKIKRKLKKLCHKILKFKHKKLNAKKN